MNDVALRANDVLRNDVGLRPTMLRLAHSDGSSACEVRHNIYFSKLVNSTVSYGAYLRIISHITDNTYRSATVFGVDCGDLFGKNIFSFGIISLLRSKRG